VSGTASFYTSLVHIREPKTFPPPFAKNAKAQSFLSIRLRILDPKRDISLSSLRRAAALPGRRVVIELV
jgi:hypothetical protein